MKVEAGKITPLSPRELNEHHFGGEWRLTVSEFHHLFHINRIEEVIPKIKFPLPPHRKTVYDFFFLERGKSVRSKGLHRCEFSDYSFFFLPAYQISTHEYVSPDSKGIFCHFDISILSRWLSEAELQEEFSFWQFAGEPLIVVDETQKPFVKNILERLLTEYQQNESLNASLISTYLLALFTELNLAKQHSAPASQNAALRITERYKNLLSQHIYKTNRVADYASMLAVTPDHLNKCIKNTLGKTSQDLLSDMIILEAKVLLKQTSLSISEIAFKFSETNPSDFTRFFKSKTHYTPKEYRNLSD